jgi:hypothetical protein
VHATPDDNLLGGRGRFLLGVLLLVVGFVLLYMITTLWPAVAAARSNKDGQVTWFWMTFKLIPDATMMLFVALVSALGSYIHVTVSFSTFAGNRELGRSWLWWYLLRAFVGSSLGVIFYFALRGGFLTGSSTSSDLNVYGIGALAGLVGLFSKQATDKLREIFETAFKTGKGFGDDVRADGLGNPEPTLQRVDPQSLPISAAAPSVDLIGTGFIARSLVKVSRDDQPATEREAKLVNPKKLRVRLQEADVANACTLTFTVTNPEPGGGTSKQQITLEVA